MFFKDKNSGDLSQGIKNLMNFLTNTANPATIAVHIVSSLFVILFIIYYFWKPTDAFIRKQKNKLDKVHNQLTVATKETETALNKLKVKQEDLKKASEKILLDHTKKGEQILAQKIKEAERRKRSIIEEGRINAKLIEDEAKKTVNEKIIALSVELTEKLIGVSIDKKMHNKVINEYIVNINEAFQSTRRNEEQPSVEVVAEEEVKKH